MVYLDVLALSKTKVRENGMKVIYGTSYVYGGVSDGRARGGVGIAKGKRWADCVKSWRCVSEKCVTVRMKITGVWLT